MHTDGTLRAVATAFVALMAASPAAAMAMWPTAWNELMVPGGTYADGTGDLSPSAIDLVGGSDGVGTFSAGYWLVSEDDDQLSLRMRLNSDGANSKSVWQFLLETDGDTSTVDWGLVVRQSGNPSLRQVYFSQATTGGATFDEVELAASGSWSGALADWRRWGTADDGSNFGGDADFFLDVAMPLSTFRAITGLGPGDAFRIALASSASHAQVNKDLPLDQSGTSPVSTGFSAPIPEPSSVALLALGLVGLGGVGRRRH